MAVNQEEKVCKSFFETPCIFSIWHYVALLFSCSLFNPRFNNSSDSKFDFETNCGEVKSFVSNVYLRDLEIKDCTFIYSFQELRRHLQVRWQDQWSLQNRSWWFGRIWSLLWSKNSRRRMGSISKETRWLCRFLPSLGWLQTRLWQSEWRVLARTGQDSPTDCVDLEDIHGATAFAEYKSFSVASERAKYQLSLGSYTGELTSACNW